jgi:hypothetical protein
MSRLRVLVFCVLSFIATALVAGDVSARSIDRFLTGSWYNPAQDGHGFSMEIGADGLVVIFWYTYHPDGTPTFLVAIGQANGNTVTAQAYYNTGMHFGEFNPAHRMQTKWGTIMITFHDCASATVEYDSDFMHGGVAFGTGSFPITRLLEIDQLQCQDDVSAGIFEGNVYSVMEDRTYYGFTLIAPGGKFVAYSDGGLTAFGTLGLNGRFFNAAGQTVSLDPNAPFTGGFSGFGELSRDYRLFATYEVDGGDRGYGDFYAAPMLYHRSTTLQGLADSYEVQNPTTGFGGNATILGDGSITGADELGCQYNGQISIPDTRFNVFEVSVTISSCPGYDGLYTGLGSQIDWFEFHDSQALRLLVTNGSFGFLLIAVR